jgi:branched-chain amino acid transport system substrate-binding protein
MKKRLDPSAGSSLLTMALVAGLAAVLSIIALVPSDNQNGSVTAGADGDAALAGGADTGAETAASGAQAGGGGGGEGGSSSQAAGGTGSAKATGSGAGSTAASCAAAKNGGATDTGVTGDSVKLAATIVADGPGSSFLGSVRVGMNAVVNKVNKAGGICGRKLNLILRNDSWDGDRGNQFIKNFVEGENVFALAVVPSSEGLRAADSYIQSKQVPVVGTDGMLIHQYKNPWIWPVATSTISTMHVMAQDAYKRSLECAKTNTPCSQVFAIVFDAKYHFGVEGAYAYNQAIKRLTGKDIEGYDASLKKCVAKFCGIQPGQPSYAREVKDFNDSCYSDRPACDFVAYLLEPDTATAWFREGRPSNPTLGPSGHGGAQPLFTRAFAEACGSKCEGMRIWTGYNPPIEALATKPGVAQFVNDVRAESASADVTNQFLEGGYQGMSLLVAALQKVGPNLTRAALKQTLDSMTFDSGLSAPLSWKQGDHFANRSAQAFSIQYNQGFRGFRQETQFIADPWVGQDIPAGE